MFTGSRDLDVDMSLQGGGGATVVILKLFPILSWGPGTTVTLRTLRTNDAHLEFLPPSWSQGVHQTPSGIAW